MESNTTQDMKPTVCKTVAGMLIYLQVQNGKTDHINSVDKAADFLSGEVPFHILSETLTVLPCGRLYFLVSSSKQMTE
jgi:hypothetical protein